MNINPSAINIYKTNSVNACQFDGSVAGVKADAVCKSGMAEKMDTVSISYEAANRREAGRITKSVMEDVRQLDRPGRLEEITKAVENGSYHISASALADTILSSMLGE